jgi:uncharacterized membrane protein YcaP (DUF421 family)
VGRSFELDSFLRDRTSITERGQIWKAIDVAQADLRLGPADETKSRQSPVRPEAAVASFWTPYTALADTVPMDSKLVGDMFHLGLPWAEKIIRPIFVYIFLIVGLRLAGKRELAQLNAFDLVVLLTISNTVQNAIIGDDNSVTGGILGAATLLSVNYAVVRFMYSHERLERLVEGSPDVLIENGVVSFDNCRRELMTLSDLQVAAHKQGLASLEEVDRAVLEPGGTVSFTAKKPTPEASRHDEILRRLDEISRRLDVRG